MLRLGAVCLLAGLCSGCALAVPQTYASPQEITLPKAMESIACGLKTYQNELARLNLNTGSIIDQVDVTLNLKASATGNSQLTVDTKTADNVALFAPIGFNYKDTLEQIGSRDNQIKITLKHVMTAGLNDAGKATLRRQPPRLNINLPRELPRREPCFDAVTVIDNRSGDPVPLGGQ